MSSPLTLLFDNGSLRAASTLNLRAVAEKLGTMGFPARAVSLLHSSAVSPDELNGEKARLLEPAVLEAIAEQPDREIRLLPFFLGPSGAITDYVPQRMAAVLEKHPAARIRLGNPLCPVPTKPDQELVDALASVARRAIAAAGFRRPAVVLVDHGTPVPAVTEVRNSLGRELSCALFAETSHVGVASMERREGDQYAFNEPLLETILRTPPFDNGEVVVLLEFLSPGRHAGPGGDIAHICDAARVERPGLRIHQSDTIGLEPALLALLGRRWRELEEAPFFQRA